MNSRDASPVSDWLPSRGVGPGWSGLLTAVGCAAPAGDCGPLLLTNKPGIVGKTLGQKGKDTQIV